MEEMRNPFTLLTKTTPENKTKHEKSDIFFSASRPEASATVTIQPPPSNLTRGGRQGKPSVRISEDFQIWGWSSAPTSSPSSGPVGASPSSGKTLPVGAEKNPEVSQNGSGKKSGQSRKKSRKKSPKKTTRVRKKSEINLRIPRKILSLECTRNV